MQSLWMLFASFMFALMSVCVKLASDLYTTFEIVMYRGIIGTAMILVLIGLRGGTLRTSMPGHHAWRGIVGVAALWFWFSAISLLPLATAVTLNYTAPIWIAAILFSTGLIQKQGRFEWGLATAILFSFAGITLLLQPTIESGQALGAMLGTISGFLSALAYLQVRHLGRLGEPEYRVVFYFSLVGVMGGLLGCLLAPSGDRPAGFSPHSGTGILLLIGIGITATIAQMAMTRAYRLGKVLLTATLQYTGIVFSSIWGILLWNDVLNWISWTGIAIILGSGMVATYYNVRSSPVKPAMQMSGAATTAKT